VDAHLKKIILQFNTLPLFWENNRGIKDKPLINILAYFFG